MTTKTRWEVEIYSQNCHPILFKMSKLQQKSQDTRNNRKVFNTQEKKQQIETVPKFPRYWITRQNF